MSIRTLADDGGYADHKYCYRTGLGIQKLGKFASKFDKTEDIIFNTENTDRLNFEDANYIIGDGANNSNIEPDKTNNELHRICTYNSIARMLPNEKEVIPINLVVSYPLNYYTKESKKDFIAYLKYKDVIKIIHNGNPKSFSINKCIVFPQTAGALYPNIAYCKNQNVGVIDIGGGTTQGCIFSNLNLVAHTKFTKHEGCFKLFNDIKAILNKEFIGNNIQDYEMPMTIQNGLLSHPVESLKYIEEIKMNYVLGIKNTMRENSWNIDNIKLLFVGGGSIILQKEIKKLFGDKASLSQEPIYDNVKGLWIVGEKHED